MKSLILLGGVTFALSFLPASAADVSTDKVPAELATNQKIIIKKKWAQASQEAKSKKLPVMIRFSDEKVCNPCREWHKTVFNTKAVKDNAGSFCIVLDYENAMSKPSADAKKLMKKYEVQSFPTVLMVDAEGQVLDTNGTSCRNPEALLRWMKKHAGK